MRVTIEGLVSGRIRDGFEELGRRRRRVLCVIAYASGTAALLLAALGRPWSVFPVFILFAVCGASYYPLHVFSRGIDYRAGPRTPLGGRSGCRSIDDGVDEAEIQLLYNVYRANRWLLSSALMALVTYPMLARWSGWWMPHGISEWGLVLAGAAGFVCSLPTVIWGWLEPGTHDLPYPADEDID